MHGSGVRATTVLVVDDAIETRDRLCAMLIEQVGADAVGCAADAGAVVALLAARRPAAIVIDVPVHDPAGFELLATLRRLAPTSVVIMLTNHTTDEFRNRSRAAGVDHFLVKAAQFEQVVELVRGPEARP